MRTIEVQLFEFSELSEEAKKKAIQAMADINVDYQWWESTYADAETVGLKLTGFDLDRNRHATGEFITDAVSCACGITENHGEACETYKTARKYLDEIARIEAIRDGMTEEEKEECYFSPDYEDAEQEANDDFLKSILEDYSIILQHECEYLQSEEAIIETIKANQYEFTQDGHQY
jgi:hypothetical protein